MRAGNNVRPYAARTPRHTAYHFWNFLASSASTPSIEAPYFAVFGFFAAIFEQFIDAFRTQRLASRIVFFLISSRRNSIELHIAEVHDPVRRDGNHVQEIDHQHPVDLARYELRRNTGNVAQRDKQNDCQLVPAAVRAFAALYAFIGHDKPKQTSMTASRNSAIAPSISRISNPLRIVRAHHSV